MQIYPLAKSLSISNQSSNYSSNFKALVIWQNKFYFVSLIFYQNLYRITFKYILIYCVLSFHTIFKLHSIEQRMINFEKLSHSEKVFKKSFSGWRNRARLKIYHFQRRANFCFEFVKMNKTNYDFMVKHSHDLPATGYVHRA